MHPELNQDTVLVPTPHCTVREQEEKYLIYNTRTDELHLVSSTGYYLYSLCDGLHDVAAICGSLASVADADADQVRTHVLGFFDALLARGIVERDCDVAAR